MLSSSKEDYFRLPFRVLVSSAKVISVFKVATTREGSGVILVNEPPDDDPEARCLWWRRGRVELPVQKKLSRIFYKLSQLFDLARLTSTDRVGPGQPDFSFTALTGEGAAAP